DDGEDRQAVPREARGAPARHGSGARAERPRHPARGRAVPLPPGRAARREALGRVRRSLHRRRHVLDAARALARDLGRHARHLRRGQEPDDRAHEARAAPRRLVAAAALGHEPRGRERRRLRALALPHDGAAPRRRAPLRGRVYAPPHADPGRLPHQAAARRHDERPGGVRLRAAGLGLAMSPGRLAGLLALAACLCGDALAEQAKRDYDAEVDAAIRSAKGAAGFEFLGTLVRTCLLPQSGGEDTSDNVPQYVADPGKAPPRETWYAEPSKVFDELYFVGGKIHSSWA